MNVNVKIELVPRSSGGYKPKFHPLIEVKGDKQVSHTMENYVVEAYRKNCNYTEQYIVKSISKSVLTNFPSKIPRFLYLLQREMPYDCWNAKTRPVLLFGTTKGHHITLTSANYTHVVDCEDGVTMVFNLVPNETYNWVESGSSNSGSFTTSGLTRFINIGIYNFRDIGGWPCYNDDGRVVGYVDYSKLYRGMGFCYYKDIEGKYKAGSAAPFMCATHPEIYQTMLDIGVTDDIDLRGWDGYGNEKLDDVEIFHGPNYFHAVDPVYPIVDGVQKIAYHQGEIRSYDWNPINKSTGAYTYTNAAKTNYDHGYHAGGRATSGDLENYKVLFSFLEIIATEGRVPNVHCATGADRTGVIVAMVMAMLGCSLNDIAKEYEYTSFNDAGAQTVNLGWMDGSSIKGAGDSGGKNIRTFLTSFFTTAELTSSNASYIWKDSTGGELGRTTVKRIVDWLKRLYTRNGWHTEAQWTSFLNSLREKMIRPA